MTRRVLFVCLGNICRSPAAENIFRRFVNDRSLNDAIQIDSCGTANYHEGKNPDSRMRQALRSCGHTDFGTARQITPSDLANFDLIVAMDRDNRDHLLALAKDQDERSKLSLFSDFLPKGEPIDIPDPYYGGSDGFLEVITLLEVGCQNLLNRVMLKVPR